MTSDVAFIAASVAAVVIMGLAKGGFAGVGVVALPVMALAVPPVQAAAITLPILVVQDAVSLRAFWRRWDSEILRAMLPGAIVGVAAGYALAAFVTVAAVNLAIGLASMIFAVNALRRGSAEPARAPPARLAPLYGAAAGFTSQVAHAGGPPFQLYVLPKRLPRDVFVGTNTLFFATGNWFKVPAYAALGQFTAANLVASAVLMPIAIAATMAGVWLVRRTGGQRFYRIMHALLVCVGAKLVADGLAGIVAPTFD